jgi:flagellar protein FliL
VPKAEAETPPGPAAKQGGRKKLLLLGLALALVAAGAGYFLLLAPSGGAADEASAHGEVVTLDPVAVNLAGGGYLKIGVALHLTEAAGGGEGGEPDGSKARDLIISQFSQARPVDVHRAREALKQALEQKIIQAYDGDVLEIYYTEYVTQ